MAAFRSFIPLAWHLKVLLLSLKYKWIGVCLCTIFPGKCDLRKVSKKLESMTKTALVLARKDLEGSLKA
jgi:hypothetical protein